MRLTMPERAGSARAHGEVREAEGRRHERQHEVPPASSAQPEAARDRGAAAQKRAAARDQQLTQSRELRSFDRASDGEPAPAFGWARRSIRTTAEERK